MVMIMIMIRVDQMYVLMVVDIVIVIIIVTVIVTVIVQGGGCRFLGRRGDFLVFPATATHWNVAKRAAFSPITATRFAEVTRLC